MSIPDEAVVAGAAAIQVRLEKQVGLNDLTRAVLEAAAPYMLIHVHHHDIEHHARSFNEGYETAVTQGLADDPSLADDWFQEKLQEAKEAAWDEAWATGCRWNKALGGLEEPNPYRRQP